MCYLAVCAFYHRLYRTGLNQRWTEIIQSRSLDCVLPKTTPILNQPKPFTSHSSAAEDVCSSKMNLSRPLSSKLIAK